MFLISIKLDKCVEKMFQKILEYCNLLLITTKFKKCVKKHLIIIIMHWNMFLIAK